MYIAVDDDAGRAHQRVAAGLERIYGNFGRRLTGVGVSGTPSDCVDGLRDIANAGAEMTVLNPVDEDSEQSASPRMSYLMSDSGCRPIVPPLSLPSGGTGPSGAE